MSRLTENEKAEIRRRADECAKEDMVDILIESENDLIQDALKDALLIVKLIHAEEINRDRAEFIKNEEERLLNQKKRDAKRRKEQKERMLRERDSGARVWRLDEDDYFNDVSVNWGKEIMSNNRDDFKIDPAMLIDLFKNLKKK